jgi:hypothetical protein
VLIASLAQRPHPIDDGLAFLRRALDDWGVELWDDGVLNTDHVMGTWTWSTVAQARERFPGAPWLDVDSACPFVGPTLGYLMIDDLHGLGEGWGNVLFPPLVKEGRGVLASTRSGAVHAAVTRQRHRLADAVGKLELDDGDVLLDRRWGPYQRAVGEEFTRALAAAGWDGLSPIGWMPTAHNPWRWNPSVAGFASEREVLTRFGHLEVDLWLYDLDTEALETDLAS